MNKSLYKLNKKIVEKYVKSNLITKRKCKYGDYWILNYTPNTVYNEKWNEFTKMCRGLIIDKDYNIVKRPFSKFFNFSELDKKSIENMEEWFEVWEKLDGSLGILYNVDNKNYISTRGSFHSDIAEIGTRILNKKYSNVDFNENYTYLFEIISPENKIVIDYYGLEDLILIGVIETKTGNEINILEEGKKLGLKTARYFGIYRFGDINELISRNIENEEGYVIKFKNNFRVKLKFENYFKLHRILSGATEKNLLEMISKGVDLNKYFMDIPEEYKNDLLEKLEYWQERYNEIFNYCLNYTFKIANYIDRKTTYIYLSEEEPKYKDIIINLLYGKDWKRPISHIWDILIEEEKNNRRLK